MFDLVGVVLQRAYFERLFLRIPTVALALGHIWHHNLRVGLLTLGSRVNQRLPVEDGSFIDLESGMNVVHSVHNEVESVPEGVILEVFSVFGDDIALSL